MKDKKLNVKIKPLGLLDLLTFKKLIPDRKEHIDSAPATPIAETAPMNALAARLHPQVQYLEISEVTQHGDNAKTFKLVPDTASGTTELAYFRAGQYLSFTFDIEGACVTRPYSISSSPADALNGFYEITVKKNDGGFVANAIWNQWQVGTKVKSSGPRGQFTYHAMRDRHKVVGIAGGSGITPFRSMAKSVVDGTLDIGLTIFYGSNILSDAIFNEELKQLEASSDGRVKVINVLADEDAENCERGFITAELIKKYVDPAECSFFICGPQAMYNFVGKELESFGLRQKFIRRELFGEIKDVTATANYPTGAAEKTFNLTVHMGSAVRTIPASAAESLLVAMERAGLRPPSVCRSGVCGYCRSVLVQGEVFIPEDEDGRRKADVKLGYIHPCSTFPLSDAEIIVPREKAKR